MFLTHGARLVFHNNVFWKTFSQLKQLSFFSNNTPKCYMMFPVLFGNNELIEKQRFVFAIPFVTNGANGSPGPKANMQRIIQDNAEGVSTLLLVVYDTRLWYLTQLGGNGQRRSADRGNCQRYSVKCLLMGHSSVFHCTVKHRELNKNRKTRESIQFFDTRDSHGKTKMLRGIVPNLSGDDYSYQRDLVPVSPKGEWRRKSLILPTVFSGKDRPCLFPSRRWGLWCVHFHARAEQLFLLLIDGEALESNSGQRQLRRDRPVTSSDMSPFKFVLGFDTSQPRLWMTLFMYSNNTKLKCRYQTQSTAPDLFWKLVGEKLH